jgi:hypothetical protein
VFVYVFVFFCVCVQVEALRRADHPSKEYYRLSLIKKLRKLSPMLQKREQAPKCGSNEEGKKVHNPGNCFSLCSSFWYCIWKDWPKSEYEIEVFRNTYL